MYVNRFIVLLLIKKVVYCFLSITVIIIDKKFDDVYFVLGEKKPGIDFAAKEPVLEVFRQPIPLSA